MNTNTGGAPRSLGVDLFQPRPAAYRAPLLNGLHRVLTDGVVLFTAPGAGSAVVTDDAAAFEMPIVRSKTFMFGPFWFVPRALVQVMRHRSRTLVLSGNLRQIELVPVLLMARILGRRTVLWLQGVGSTHSSALEVLRKIAFGLPTCLLTYSDQSKLELSSYRTEADIYVCRNTTARPAPEPGDTVSDIRRAVGFVGRLDARKHVESIIRATAAARNAGLEIELHLVGDGPERERLQDLAAQLDLDDSVHFHGATSDWAITKSLLSLCDVVAFPAAAGLGVVDAMAAARGAIVVGSDPNNGPEWRNVIDGQNGLVLPDASVGTFTAQLMELYRQPDRLRAFSAAAATTYSNGLTVEDALIPFVQAVGAPLAWMR